MNITVLCGGHSPERDVSLASGRRVAQALRERGHVVYTLDLARDVVPNAAGGTRDIDIIKAIDTQGFLTGVQPPIGRGVLEACARSDVTFLALHGGIGEDGHLQAALDCLGVRYTGSGLVGSLLAMDKELTKRLLDRDGIPTAPWCCVRPDDDPDAAVERITRRVGLPCVVKPCRGGSSVGVTMVETATDLRRALTQSCGACRLIVERQIRGRELSVGILGGQLLPPVEIIINEGFYDYDTKYRPGRAREICPADLTAAELDRLNDCALRAFDCLRLDGYARGDFILDADGVPWCLEFNTLPGMTPTSLLPMEAAAVGIDYGELCERMIMLALK